MKMEVPLWCDLIFRECSDYATLFSYDLPTAGKLVNKKSLCEKWKYPRDAR